jgi:hypothetical protein
MALKRMSRRGFKELEMINRKTLGRMSRNGFRNYE